MGIFLATASIGLTFNGFPMALVSLLGSALVLIGYQVSISTLTHSDSPTGRNPWQRFLAICLGFAVASIGRAVIQWGGLISINVGLMVVDLYAAGVVAGVLGGLFNIDKYNLRERDMDKS